MKAERTEISGCSPVWKGGRGGTSQRSREVARVVENKQKRMRVTCKVRMGCSVLPVGVTIKRDESISIPHSTPGSPALQESP